MVKEIQIDDNCFLSGVIVESDASFDHEFGTEKRAEFEVEDFAVYVYIQDIDYDITSSLTQNQIDSFKEVLIQDHLEDLLN